MVVTERCRLPEVMSSGLVRQCRMARRAVATEELAAQAVVRSLVAEQGVGMMAVQGRTGCQIVCARAAATEEIRRRAATSQPG